MTAVEGTAVVCHAEADRLYLTQSGHPAVNKLILRATAPCLLSPIITLVRKVPSVGAGFRGCSQISS